MSGAAARIGIGIALLLAALPPRALPAEAVVRPTQRPFLYRIEGTPASFLYGTIHLPDDRVLALPRAVRLALQRADVLVTELDLDAKTQAALVAGLSLPAGHSVSSLLPAELRARLERFLASRGLGLQPFERFKLLALGAQLEALDYLDARRPPLDPYLMELAAGQRKAREALETPEEQIAAFDALSLGEQIAVLDEGLAALEKRPAGEPSPAEKLVRAYVAGDEQALWAESMTQFDADDPAHRKFFDVVIARRNTVLAQRIDALLERRPARAYFVAIGALHLFTPDGVIALLEKRGRTLQRLDGNDSP
jgi:hypothetical protein